MDAMSRNMEILRENKKYIEGKNEQGQQHVWRNKEFQQRNGNYF